MNVSLFVGDLTDAPAEAVCTSTNPRLSLMEGTGGRIREKGGYVVLRECEGIIEAESLRSGRNRLPVGSAIATTAGVLPFKVAIHCVASDSSYRSSPEVVRACVENALARADESGCSSVAMPVFATGHAHFKFDRALTAMAETLRDASTEVEEVIIVIYDQDKLEKALACVREVIGDARVEVG